MHCAPADVNGPVVAFLFGFVPGGFEVNGDLAEFTLRHANILADVTPTATCPNDIDDLGDLAEAMRDGNFYVIIRTVANPPGEIRGQPEE